MSSEQLHDKVERNHEQIDLHETSRHNLERIHKEAENAEHDHSISKIQESIHKEAISAKEITVGEHRTDSGQPYWSEQKELKTDAYSRTIQKIRGRLNPAERILSKTIHNRVIEPVSEFSSKTIGRPSGILGGGIVALVGSAAVLYMAKHYGFRYNFTTFLVLMAAGFAVGLSVDLLIQLVKRKRA
jgi:hypothetical protein